MRSARRPDRVSSLHSVRTAHLKILVPEAALCPLAPSERNLLGEVVVGMLTARCAAEESEHIPQICVVHLNGHVVQPRCAVSTRRGLMTHGSPSRAKIRARSWP